MLVKLTRGVENAVAAVTALLVHNHESKNCIFFYPGHSFLKFNLKFRRRKGFGIFQNAIHSLEIRDVLDIRCYIAPEETVVISLFYIFSLYLWFTN